jgi:hypothetical protein
MLRTYKLLEIIILAIMVIDIIIKSVNHAMVIKSMQCKVKD